MKPKLSAQQKEDIQRYIKNGIDISPLISAYSIAGENFSGAIIKSLQRPDEDISGVILTNCIIGEDEQVTNLNRAIVRNCNFRGSTWKGSVWARRADFRYTSLVDAFIPRFDYKYADLRYCDLCGATFQILSDKGLGAKVSSDLFSAIEKFWDVKILSAEDYIEYKKLKEVH